MIEFNEDHARENQAIENRITFCRSLGFKCWVTAPEQAVGGLNQSLDLGVLPVGVNEIDFTHFQAGDPGPLRNFSPLGTWQINIKPEASTGTMNVLELARDLPINLAYLKQFMIQPSFYIEAVLCLSILMS